MDITPLSLVYLARPSTRSEAAPALLVLLHGNGSTERFIFDRIQHVDPRFVIVSPRGPHLVAPDSYAWLQVTTTEAGYVYDPQEAQEAFVTILRFLHEAATAYRVPPERTYVLGFSQGAQFAGALGIVSPEAIAGMVLIGAPLPEEVFALAAPPERLAHLSCFMAHGIDDPIIPISQMRANRDRIGTLVPSLTYREYAGGHELSDDCLTDVSAWLTAQLNETSEVWAIPPS